MRHATTRAALATAQCLPATLAAQEREASVVAEKRWRCGDPEDVRVELRRLRGDDGSVLVCALWGERSSCDEDGYRSRNESWNWGGRSNDVAVQFTVRLPDGVRLVTSSVNGGIRIEGATSAVEAETVNGSITAGSTGGPVEAKTDNGSIDVRMGTALRHDASFTTVNGSIEVSIPEGLDADLEMTTTNRSVRTDFPVTVQGRMSRRRLEATLGKGGPELRLETVNGDVRLRKG
jgi:hypothetical protein